MKKLEAVKKRNENPLNRSGMQVNHTLTAMRIAIERVQDDRAFLLKLVELSPPQHKWNCCGGLHIGNDRTQPMHKCTCGLTALLEQEE